MKPVRPGATGTRFALADPNDEGSRRFALAHWTSPTATTHSPGARSSIACGNIISEPVSSTAPVTSDIWVRSRRILSCSIRSPSGFATMRKGRLGKKLHRLIVTSKAYRQSSMDRADGSQSDAENRNLWRMNRTRLDAESVHDAMLAVSGQLDLTMGGPGAQLFWFKDDHSPVYDYTRFDPSSKEAFAAAAFTGSSCARSPTPSWNASIGSDPSMLAPKRGTTITAIQALALLNNPFVVWLSERFAGARRSRSGSRSRRPDPLLAYRLALSRDPSTVEAGHRLSAYAARNGMANACRLLFNSNEFVFVD